MLNKNQSKQKNAFKYAFIIPVIIVFMVLFQIKIVAQENQSKPQNDTDVSPDTKQVVEMVWDKTTNDEEIQNDIKWMKKEGLNIVVRELNRNSKDEIINIKIEFTDKSGKKGKFSHSGDEPIKPIVLRREIEKNNKTTVSLAELTKLEEELITPIAPIAPLETENFAELPEVPLVPEIPDTPLIQAPSNTNDEKAWREYENQIKKQELAMLAQDSEMKKYEAQMQAYEEKMRAREKKLEAHENEMKRFDQQMEVYQKNIENYYKKIDHYRKLEKKE